MKQPRTRRLITENLEHHHATIAWNRLKKAASAPTVIHALKPPRAGKCAVFRLLGIAAGRNVVAKRCSVPELQYELFIYRSVLSALPSRTPTLLGYLEDESSNEAWIFMEDVGDASYDHSDPNHRALALQWLGRMHAASRTLPDRVISQLNGAGSAMMRARARKACANLEEALSHGALDSSTKGVVARLLETLAPLRGDMVFDVSQSFDPCLVHGDFTRKNIRLADSAVVVFDWEHAAWGDSSIDLAAFRDDDLGPYLVEMGTAIDSDRLRRQAQLGMVQRLVQSVEWELPGLNDSPPTRSTERLRLYEAKLASEIAALSIRKVP